MSLAGTRKTPTFATNEHPRTMMTPSFAGRLYSLPLSIALLAAIPCTAQVTMADILQKKAPLTCVGMDFSEAHFTPRFEFEKLEKRGSVFLNEWNNLIEAEPAKYDLGKPLGLDYVGNVTSYVLSSNGNFQPAKAFQAATGPLSDKDIAGIVSKYPTKGVAGAGVVFFVNSFNKTAEQAQFTMVFFDMGTRKVLHTERLQGKPGGFGLQNFWAGALVNVLKQIETTYAPAWRVRFAQ